MKKRLLLLIIFVTSIISLISFFLILNYLDPYEYKAIGISFLVFTFMLSISGIFTIILYFFKKVYYRGRVYVHNVFTSFRQWFFIGLFIIFNILLNIIWVPIIISFVLLFIIFSFLELFIQNLENK